MKKKITVLFVVSLILIGGVFCQTFKNIRVDKLTDLPNEVTISINPSNPQILAAGSNLDYFYYSMDGGLTWNQKTMTSQYGVFGDPVVLYDDENNLYFSHLKSSGPNFADRIVIQRSKDFGKTWTHESFTTPNGPKFQDKEWMGVDLSAGSPYKNNLYIAWTEFDQYGVNFNDKKSRILFARSENRGESWSGFQKISDLEGNCEDGDLTTEGAVPATGPNGEVYVSWSYNSKIYFDKSLDGGKTFGTDVVVTDQPGGWELSIPGINRCNGMPVTKCDVSNSSYRGRIYVNWTDQRNGSDNVDVFLAYSDDKGESWSDPIKVNNDNSGRHQFFTWMAVDRTDGNIYIIFYDRRDTQGNATDVYLACSNDGGKTFGNIKISESSFIPSSKVFFGDYSNIDAHNGKIHPIWSRMDNSNTSIWTTILTKEEVWNIIDIDEPKEEVKTYQLKQNYPNPFNPETIIEYDLPQRSFVTIKVFDSTGREVTTLVKETKEAGRHNVSFNGESLSSGVYIYKMFADNFQAVGKMVLIK